MLVLSLVNYVSCIRLRLVGFYLISVHLWVGACLGVYVCVCVCRGATGVTG